MNPQLRIELEIIVSKIEESYGSYGDYIEIVSKDDHYKLRMECFKSKNALVIFIVINTVETVLHEIQNEVSEGKSDVLVIGYLDSDEKSLVTKFLPKIEGYFNYSLNNYSAVLWNDNRIRHTSKAGIFLLKMMQTNGTVSLIFTPQIHPGVSLFDVALPQKEQKVKRYIPGVFSTTLYVRFENILRPIWNLLPLPARRFVKRLSRYV